jgi:hypothetical protein
MAGMISSRFERNRERSDLAKGAGSHPKNPWVSVRTVLVIRRGLHLVPESRPNPPVILFVCIVKWSDTRGGPVMLFRLEPVPFYRGEQSIAGRFKHIDVLAVLPVAVEPDGSIRNAFLCRTDTGLERIEERQVWNAMERGQYRVARRSVSRSGT